MILILASVIVFLVYWYSVRNFQYWQEKGVKHRKPVPFFGNTLLQLLQQISISDLVTQTYNAFPKEKIVGHFIGNHHALILRDPEIIKYVLVADFRHFYPRGLLLQKEVHDPLMRNLFTIDGDTWKLLRQRMTPAFTSGKLKAMFPLIVERTKKLLNLAADVAKSGKEVDVRDLMARYTTDFIGACGFGLDTDALNDENSMFRKLGKRIFTATWRDAFVIVLKVLGPGTFKHVNFFASEIQTNTVALVRNVMNLRNYKPSGRGDFIDLLMELKQQGTIIGESMEHRDKDGMPRIVELEMDDVLMAAQAFIFFAAGFETSSSTSSYMLHQLAFHQHIQKKCQDEIREVLSKHGGNISYEAVLEMQYLRMTFMESIRMLPPLGFITRKCASIYAIPGTDVTIDADTLIIIPVHALHHDERYFADPEQFKPERFHPDNVGNIKKYTYLPFGAGPRACIGERLGIMQSMAGLAMVLSHFSVIPSENSVRKPSIDPTSMVVSIIKGGIPLTLVARKKMQ